MKSVLVQTSEVFDKEDNFFYIGKVYAGNLLRTSLTVSVKRIGKLGSRSCFYRRILKMGLFKCKLFKIV